MKILIYLLILITLVAGYFLFWPVPIEPVAWQAPTDQGYVDEFAPNNLLSGVELISIDDHEGPEDFAVDKKGQIYMSVLDGSIVRLTQDGTTHTWAKTDGRPLGIEFDRKGNLIVADAFLGLLSINPEGEEVTLLTDTVEDTPIQYADNVDIGRDGKIYFSDASTKFAASTYGGTYKASLLDIIEHGGHGRVLVYIADFI